MNTTRMNSDIDAVVKTKMNGFMRHYDIVCIDVELPLSIRIPFVVGDLFHCDFMIPHDIFIAFFWVEPSYYKGSEFVYECVEKLSQLGGTNKDFVYCMLCSVRL
jgi:hypothetical protein